MVDPERKYIQQASSGDVAAIEALLEKHLPGLQAFVRRHAGRLLLSREDSSDLVQSTCREVLSDLKHFEYRGESAFRKWLYATALHKVVDRARYYRAGKRDGAEPRGGADSDSPTIEPAHDLTPSRHAIGREDKLRFQQKLTELSDDYRRVIELARIQGLPHREVAERMDRSEGAVRVLLSRAMARLATLLDDP